MATTTRARLAAFVLSATTAACASAPKASVLVTAPPAPPAPVTAAASPAPALDPVAALLAQSERHFATGESELKVGHLERARLEFDRSLDILLESPYGARTDVRIRDQFDRFVDRISAYEATALTAGDGFTEKPSELASIDELLSSSAFAVPNATPSPAVAEAVRGDLAATKYDVPIPFNDRVLQYVEVFQGRLRDWFGAGLQRGARYLPMIQSVFRAEGLPLDLAYVPLIESAFKASAVSRASAKGFWQFMRPTAVENGLKHDWYVDERADPEKATVAAAKYLRTLSNMFDGDWHLALASYNGGPGRVQRAMKRSGLDDFWSLTETSKYLPRETRDYVPMILAAVIIARNPQQYGFDVTPEAPLSYETVAVPRATDLRKVAEWAGTTIDEIQTLNPELRRWTTPLRTPDYSVKVPLGSADVLRTRLESAPPTDLASLKWHTVKRGDTIATLAKRFAVKRADLAEANQLSLKARLRPGQELLIPRAPSTVVAANTRPSTAEPTSARSTTGGTASRASYRVRRGDTLYSIARQHGVSIDDLKSWNSLRSSRLSVGDTLTVRRGRSASASAQ
ncbi:MAG: LysM peptidoglycan-binding domain-containing protein [Acidobacteria bacterium]|nr:LysM peptidoglycan-binding domain-containing protein [Acidobacteriota bacterium]